jgi:hypothetical protein
MARVTVTVADGLTRLNKDIADAEARVAQAQAQVDEARAALDRLLSMRDGVLPFFREYVSDEMAASGGGAAAGGAFVDEVVAVFLKHRGTDLDVDRVWEILQENGSHANRDRVRNSLNYAVRLEKIERGSRRGTYILKDTSTPVAAGVDVNEESDSEGSSGEIGDGRDDTSAPPHDQGGGAHDARFHLGRAGDRAPIGG